MLWSHDRGHLRPDPAVGGERPTRRSDRPGFWSHPTRQGSQIGKYGVVPLNAILSHHQDRRIPRRVSWAGVQGLKEQR